MRNVLITMGFAESGIGLSLLAVPSFVSALLLGTHLDSAALVVARVCGAGLLSLGIACLLARDERAGGAAGLVRAMLVYNIITTAVLAYGALGLHLTGIALWPAVVAHAALAIWCAVSVRSVTSF